MDVGRFSCGLVAYFIVDKAHETVFHFIRGNEQFLEMYRNVRLLDEFEEFFRIAYYGFCRGHKDTVRI